jgi:two-component system chemotaxis response regulator CheY
MKCLVVDDSAITRRILVNNLRAIGFAHILEATDGKQALEICTPDVDIVLTDWNMPGMAGVDLVRSLRTNPALRDIPVLLITARTAREDVIEAASAGVNGYVIKPFSSEVLKLKIEETLERVRPPGGQRSDDVSPAAGTGTEG